MTFLRKEILTTVMRVMRQSAIFSKRRIVRVRGVGRGVILDVREIVVPNLNYVHAWQSDEDQ